MSVETRGARSATKRSTRSARRRRPSSAKAPRVDADIASAVRSLGATVKACRRVTGLPSPVSDRATFRLTLADGRVVKARRLSRVATAERYVAVVRALPHLPLAPILVRRGRVTIETWVDGVSLAERPVPRAQLARAAGILRALHAVRRLGRRGLARRASTRSFAADLARRLDVLVAHEALTTTEATRLRAMLARSRPATAPTGVIHSDFCPENLVEDRSGRLHVIDNGGIQVGFLAYDLARCWYRWPMPPARWRAFLAAYAERGRTPSAFWRLAAVLRSAHFRVIREHATAADPLRRLRTLARPTRPRR